MAACAAPASRIMAAAARAKNLRRTILIGSSRMRLHNRCIVAFWQRPARPFCGKWAGLNVTNSTAPNPKVRERRCDRRPWRIAPVHAAFGRFPLFVKVARRRDALRIFLGDFAACLPQAYFSGALSFQHDWESGLV